MTIKKYIYVSNIFSYVGSHGTTPIGSKPVSHGLDPFTFTKLKYWNIVNYLKDKYNLVHNKIKFWLKRYGLIKCNCRIFYNGFDEVSQSQVNICMVCHKQYQG
jgi:hypothetical protein